MKLLSHHFTALRLVFIKQTAYYSSTAVFSFAGPWVFHLKSSWLVFDMKYLLFLKAICKKVHSHHNIADYEWVG